MLTVGKDAREVEGPEGVALRAVRLTGRDEPGTFGARPMTSPRGTGDLLITDTTLDQLPLPAQIGATRTGST